MSARKPLVSILLITMNHEEFIEKACKSAIHQTYPDIEIIFLDNCSRDDTANIAKKVLQNSQIPYKFIKNTESFGVAKNLNIMVCEASGDFVSILSGDDWWTENLIEEKVKFIHEGNYDFVFSDGYKFIQETQKTIPAYEGRKKKKIIQNLPHFFELNIIENQTVNVGTFIKKKLLTSHPFDEEIQTEDWDMNLRMTKLGYKPGFIDKKLFYYRIISSSLSRKWDVMLDSYKKVTKKYADFIEANPSIKKAYHLKLLFFEYQILLNKAHSDEEKKKINTSWKKEKYKIKYKQPLRALKMLFIR